MISQTTIIIDQPVQRRARLRIFEPSEGSIGAQKRYIFVRRDQGLRVQLLLPFGNPVSSPILKRFGRLAMGVGESYSDAERL